MNNIRRKKRPRSTAEILKIYERVMIGIACGYVCFISYMCYLTIISKNI